ncbi:MAG: hypothetical protein AB7O97_24075 [Planctomycetota bacterium]
MRHRRIAIGGAALGAAVLWLGAAPAPGPGAERAPAFVAVDVFVAVGANTLAAWQLEVVAPGARLVGVEGSDPGAFAEAPRYDPAALRQDRVILAALAAGDALPTGRVRVARLHFERDDAAPAPPPALLGLVAADRNGLHILARAELAPVEKRK